MGKHNFRRDPHLPAVAQGAFLVGAIAVGVAMPAGSALATTVNVPGVGDVNVPVGPEFDQQVQQVNRALDEHSDQFRELARTLTTTLPRFPDLSNDVPIGNLQDNTPGLRALEAARTRVGASYVWGGSGPSTFDCSGLTKWAYQRVGIEIPRTSFEQSHIGEPVAYQDLLPGDLVIQNSGAHVAMYAGDGRILQASQSGEPVDFAVLNPDSIVTARRIS